MRIYKSLTRVVQILVSLTRVVLILQHPAFPPEGEKGIGLDPNNNNKPKKKGPNNKSKKSFVHSKEIIHAYQVAKSFILSGKTPDSAIINELLGTNITDKDLNNLLNGPNYVFKDLTDKKVVIEIIRNLCKEYNCFSGIYIWTHGPTGSKYVGSSKNLPSRIANYFRVFKPEQFIGSFIPFLISSPISEFTLEVIFSPSNDYRSEMVLEQYFLLLPEYNLNTLRVSNNVAGQNCKRLFMYNKDGTICYYKSDKQLTFVHILGVSHVTFTKHRDNGTYYLNKYLFTNKELPNAAQSNMTLEEVSAMLDIDRIIHNKIKNTSSF